MVRPASTFAALARLLHRLGPPPPTPRRHFARRVEHRLGRAVLSHRHAHAHRRIRPR